MRRNVAIALSIIVLSGCGVLPGEEVAGWLPGPGFSDQNSSLTIWVTDPLCPEKLGSGDVKVTTEETERSVIITASVPNHGQAACKALLKAVPVRVELSSPIGDRTLLDGGRTPPAPPVDDFGAGPIPITNN